MPIEDYLSGRSIPQTRHPPSRVRAMLLTVGNQLQAQAQLNRTFAFLKGRTAYTSELLAAVEEALEEWRKLDALIAQETAQRQRIAARISSFVKFYSDIRGQLRIAEPKPRRPLTVEEQVVANAKRLATRRLRHTMGKRQKKNIKA